MTGLGKVDVFQPVASPRREELLQALVEHEPMGTCGGCSASAMPL